MIVGDCMGYTGREIAVFTDVHGLYYPLKAVLEDISKRGITEIYSLGDNICFGPDPSLVLNLLIKYKVKVINGNSEEYIVLGTSPFRSYFTVRKQEMVDWTKSKLNKEQIDFLNNNKHSYDLVVGGKRIGLCHFANDVRIDFDEHSTWTYQDSINRHFSDESVQKQFYYTNSPKQKELVQSRNDTNNIYDAGYVSFKNDPIFDGKTIDKYDEIIQGHVHFKHVTSDDNVKIRTIRAVGMAFGNDDPNYASYVIIKEKDPGYDIEEVLVSYDREATLESISNSDMPDKATISKYIG